MQAKGIKYGRPCSRGAASGRAIANGRDEGFTKLISTRRRTAASAAVSSARMPAISSAKSASLWKMGCDPADIGKTIHPPPTLSESIGMAAELFEGVCTDMPPVKKK